MRGELQRLEMGNGLEVVIHAEGCPLLAVIPAEGLMIPGGAQPIICTCRDPDAPQCSCGESLRQIPTLDAYSCLACGALVAGGIVHGVGKRLAGT
jgi:hypothetical protein